MSFLYDVQAIVLALAVGVTAVVGAEPSTQPNLVHIVVDDLGFNDVGYKNAEVLSPNLDKLRAEGVELARFYSAKWCAPSRATMLTGRYAWRSGYYSDQNSRGVSLDTELLPAVLQRAGYRTYVRNESSVLLHHVAIAQSSLVCTNYSALPLYHTPSRARRLSSLVCTNHSALPLCHTPPRARRLSASGTLASR